MYRQQSKYEPYKNCWDDGQISSLKRENYNLTTELSKTKKNYDLLQKEKKDLENRLLRVELAMKSLNANRVGPQFPSEIENLLDKVEDDLKSKLYPKIETLLNCMTCIVCKERVKSVVYINCRHLVACTNCNDKLGNDCPLCRQENFTKVTIYH